MSDGIKYFEVCISELTSTYVKCVKEGDNTTVLPTGAIPAQYENVVDSYVSFLNGEQPVISDVNYLLSCFNISTYVENDKYNDWLVNKLYDSWDKMATNEDKREFGYQMLFYYDDYLSMLPDTALTNKLFNLWLGDNKNTSLTVADGTVYSNTYIKLLPNDSNDSNNHNDSNDHHGIGYVLTVNHIVNDTTKFKFVLLYYKNKKLDSKKLYKNDELVKADSFMDVDSLTLTDLNV